MISFVDENGYERFLGNIEPAGGLTCSWPTYGDVPAAPMIPRSRWSLYCSPGAEIDPYLPYVHDQDGIGMCNASATCAAMERSRLMQGLPPVKLSGGDLYMRICGGSDRGSTLEDGIRAAMQAGVATTRTVPYLDWRGDNPGAAEERKNHKVIEAFLCPTFDHCFSAVCCGFSLVSGIMWFNNYKPDGDGWLPAPGWGGGGHAVMGYAPATRNGQFGIWHQNSWTAQWGRQGRCVFPESAYRGPVGGWWAVRAVTDEGAGELPAPKFRD